VTNSKRELRGGAERRSQIEVPHKPGANRGKEANAMGGGGLISASLNEGGG